MEQLGQCGGLVLKPLALPRGVTVDIKRVILLKSRFGNAEIIHELWFTHLDEMV